MSQDKLSILGMAFHAHHGLHEDEITHGQRFEVDVEMSIDISQAAQTDDLQDTVDVRYVFNKVKSIVVDQRFFLIETMCEKIADCLLLDEKIYSVVVRVRKPFAPLGGLANGTQIEIHRRK